MEEAAIRRKQCDAIPKLGFINEVEEEIEQSLGRDYELLPLYERSMFEHAFKNHYSFESNEHLRCQWNQYKLGIETKKYVPFELPDIRQIHFYNCAIRFHPAASIMNQDHRKKMRVGPGVDRIGQIPIPHEDTARTPSARRPSDTGGKLKKGTKKLKK